MLRRPHLLRELIVILALKSLVLWLIWSNWFSNPEDKEVIHQQIGSVIYSDSLNHQPSQDKAHAPGSRTR